MPLARKDLGHHHSLELARKEAHPLDLDSEHGEPFAQFLGRPCGKSTYCLSQFSVIFIGGALV